MDRAEVSAQPAPAPEDWVEVEVVHCAARAEADRTRVRLPVGACVADAIAVSGVLARHPGLVSASVGVWGKLATGTRLVRDGDRIELYRPLQLAPMEARRSRQREQQRSRQTRRPGSASGA